MGELAVKRRDLLGALGASWLVDQVAPDRMPPRGRIVGASHRVGHLLRDAHDQGADAPPERRDLVIVGSGASALSAAWRLRDAGLDTLMLELEPFVGGTSSWSDDGTFPHPWGAHYLPLPERGARTVARLLSDLGVITGWDAAGRPEVDEATLCHSPEERIFYQGAWHNGIVPLSALSKEDRAQIERFRDIESRLQSARGNDGREAFAIPAAHSSRDPRYLELDRITMDQWLHDNGFTSPFLRWYVQYATRDDFGADLDQVSAWAGLHYFAARKLETPQSSGTRFLVWPEGNGWLLRNMLSRLAIERRHNALVVSVRNHAKGGVSVRYIDVGSGRRAEVHARGAILAVPRFIATRLLGDDAPFATLPARASSPWLVANLHTRLALNPNRAWDSILYDAAGLGFVNAAHQRPGVHEHTVLTYYRAFGGPEPHQVRAQLLQQGWSTLATSVIADLAPAEPTLATATERLDIMLWGHGMPRPTPGFLGTRPFEAPTMLTPAVAWAHVDQSGFAIFEEANARGVQASEALATRLGVALGESWT